VVHVHELAGAQQRERPVLRVVELFERRARGLELRPIPTKNRRRELLRREPLLHG